MPSPLHRHLHHHSPLWVARPDPRLRVWVRSSQPLHYAGGPDRALDRPGHVRAASAIIATGQGGHVIVQDDSLFLAHLHAAGVQGLALPAPQGVRQFDTGRGNKDQKPDLEAGCCWPTPTGEVLVAFGSGSTPRREQILVAPLSELAAARFLDAAPLYACLRRALPEGAELNLEGAWRGPQGHLHLLQRGNGLGAIDGLLVVEGAWLDALLARPQERSPLPPPPRLLAVERWSLGRLDGERLTFTDGIPLPGGGGGGGWLFSATAEASPDAVADGPVTGSVVGWASAEAGVGGGWAPLQDAAGAPLAVKLEGIAPLEPGALLGVLDADDPQQPSLLLHLALEGPWPTG